MRVAAVVGGGGGGGCQARQKAGLRSGSRPLLPPADPLRLTGGFLLSSQERYGGVCRG